MADHKITPEVSEFLSQIGRKGGAVTSERKAHTSRTNGKKGGRKPLPPEEMNEAQRKRRERYLAQKEKMKFSDL